jgi:hypothetical protein
MRYELGINKDGKYNKSARIGNLLSCSRYGSEPLHQTGTVEWTSTAAIVTHPVWHKALFPYPVSSPYIQFHEGWAKQYDLASIHLAKILRGR